jgi:RHS repeat-associated protein
VFFYGVDGQQLGAYPLSSGASALEIATYFGSKRLGFNTNPSNGSETATAPDRLGSYGSYYPWGESKSGNNPADIWSYATYWRDSFTGLDYANQRYYSNVQGRFMTPDSYKAFGLGANDPKNPQSWNHYAYVVGDPINRVDPAGQDDDDPDGFDFLAGGSGSATGDWFTYFLNLGDAIAAQIAAQVNAAKIAAQVQAAQAAMSLPSCQIGLYTQSAKFEGDPFLHTFLEVSLTVGGSTITNTLEAGPINGYLNNLNDLPITIPGSAPAQGGNAYHTKATELTPLASGSGACGEAGDLLALARSYPTNTYKYFQPYNSNSFTYSLLKYAGVSTPWWVTPYLLLPVLGPVPQAPGWGLLIPSWGS